MFDNISHQQRPSYSLYPPPVDLFSHIRRRMFYSARTEISSYFLFVKNSKSINNRVSWFKYPLVYTLPRAAIRKRDRLCRYMSYRRRRRCPSGTFSGWSRHADALVRHTLLPTSLIRGTPRMQHGKKESQSAEFVPMQFGFCATWAIHHHYKNVRWWPTLSFSSLLNFTKVKSSAESVEGLSPAEKVQQITNEAERQSQWVQTVDPREMMQTRTAYACDAGTKILFLFARLLPHGHLSISERLTVFSPCPTFSRSGADVVTCR